MLPWSFYGTKCNYNWDCCFSFLSYKFRIRWLHNRRQKTQCSKYFTICLCWPVGKLKSTHIHHWLFFYWRRSLFCSRNHWPNFTEKDSKHCIVIETTDKVLCDSRIACIHCVSIDFYDLFICTHLFLTAIFSSFFAIIVDWNRASQYFRQ